MAFDGLGKAFNAKNVSIWIDNPSLSEVINTYDLSTKKITGRNRIETRGGIGDFWGGQLLEVTFEAVITADLFLVLDTLNTLNARNALPLTDMRVLNENLGGVGGDDITEDFQGEIPDIESFAVDVGYKWVKVKIIIRNGTYSAV